MAYSQPAMILIFIKPRFDGSDADRTPICVGAPKRRREEAVIGTDVQRSGVRTRATKDRYPADTCVSTVSLWNANFAQS